MLRQDAQPREVAEREQPGRVWLPERHLDGVVVGRLQAGNRLSLLVAVLGRALNVEEAAAPVGGGPFVHCPLKGEAHVLRGERLAIREVDALPEGKRVRLCVRRYVNLLGEVGHGFELVVDPDERAVDQPLDALLGAGGGIERIEGDRLCPLDADLTTRPTGLGSRCRRGWRTGRHGGDRRLGSRRRSGRGRRRWTTGRRQGAERRHAAACHEHPQERAPAPPAGEGSDIRVFEMW